MTVVTYPSVLWFAMLCFGVVDCVNVVYSIVRDGIVLTWFGIGVVWLVLWHVRAVQHCTV